MRKNSASTSPPAKPFFLDQLKNLLLIAVLGGALVAALNALYQVFADRLWLFILLAWATASLVMAVMFSLNRVFVKIFNKLTPLPEGTLRERIESLAASVGFRVSAISVMDASRRSTKLNAFFSGLGRTREVVLYDTLIEKMSEDEITAVLAHELGHAVHKDVPRMLLQKIILVGAYLALFGLVAGAAAWHRRLGFPARISASACCCSASWSARWICCWISRSTSSAARRSMPPMPLPPNMPTRNHPQRIDPAAQENLANLNPHPLYVLLHYSHPTLAQRLGAIGGDNKDESTPAGVYAPAAQSESPAGTLPPSRPIDSQVSPACRDGSTFTSPTGTPSTCR